LEDGAQMTGRGRGDVSASSRGDGMSACSFGFSCVPPPEKISHVSKCVFPFRMIIVQRVNATLDINP
jgi:hypothetical protein